MMDLTFVTGNEHKANYLSRWLDIPLAHRKLDLDEIQSLDLHKVAEHKVRQAYATLQKPVLVEDAALSFESLGRLPGTYIKWFTEELGLQGLIDLAMSLPTQRAHGLLVYALYDGNKLEYFTGEMHGVIAPAPRGGGGFGFDAIFINDGYTITRAEMNEAEYQATSYRNEAMQKLGIYLRSGL